MCIEPNHRWQVDRIQCAVMQRVIDCTGGVTQRMHAAEAFLKCHGSLHGGTHHLQTRFTVATVARRYFNIRPCTSQAIQANPISRRIERGCHEGLHAMRNRVHTGRGRQERRQTQREIRVEDRRLRHQIPRMKTELSAIIDNHNRTACHLTARARRCRNCDQWQHSLADTGRSTFDGGVVCHRAFMGRNNRDPLGTIHRRSATEGD